VESHLPTANSSLPNENSGHDCIASAVRPISFLADQFTATWPILDSRNRWFAHIHDLASRLVEPDTPVGLIGKLAVEQTEGQRPQALRLDTAPKSVGRHCVREELEQEPFVDWLVEPGSPLEVKLEPVEQLQVQVPHQEQEQSSD
jgi:hypothetical protein